MVVVRAALRFGNNAVDHAEFLEVGRGELESFGRLGCVAAVFPKDRGATFGTDHRIVGVLHDEHFVGHADAECAARTAFAYDHRDDRGFEKHHLAQIHRDGFGDVSFLGTDAGESPGRVDQRDDGQFELGRHAHDPQRLAVSFGMRAAEVAHNVFLGVAPLLVGHHRDGTAADLGQPAGHGRVVAEQTVAVQLGEVCEAETEVIEGERPRRVAGDLHPLPCGQVLVDLLAQSGDLLLDLFHLGLDGQFLTVGTVEQILQAFLQLGDGLFEIQWRHFHENDDFDRNTPSGEHKNGPLGPVLDTGRPG